MIDIYSVVREVHGKLLTLQSRDLPKARINIKYY